MGNLKLSLDEIRPGVRSGSEICDPSGRVLVSKGLVLTEDILEGLESRGISELYVSPQEWSRLTGKASSTAEQESPSRSNLSARRVDRSREGYCQERTQRFSQQLASALDVIDGIGSNIQGLAGQMFNQLRQLPNGFAEMLIEDSDQSISATRQSVNDSLSSRSATASMLAMAVGMEMELEDDEISLVGGACLFHDLGLFLLPPQLQNPTQALSADEANLYRSHPQLTANLLAEFPAVSEELRVLTLQVHELPDGSGYPRGIQQNRFHRLTRITNVVEVYLALTGPAPLRPPLVPHDALAFMLFQCQQGLLDPQAMRALVNQLSLFGIDSAVKLDNGQNAKVIRRDAAHYDAPVVLLEGDEETNITRLSETSFSIVAPVAHSSQMRIVKSAMKNTALSQMIFS